jgi:hypothetical protein
MASAGQPAHHADSAAAQFCHVCSMGSRLPAGRVPAPLAVLPDPIASMMSSTHLPALWWHDSRLLISRRMRFVSSSSSPMESSSASIARVSSSG